MKKRLGILLIIAVTIIVLVVLIVYFFGQKSSKEGKFDQVKAQIETVMGRLESLESQRAEMQVAAESIAEQLAVINKNLGQMDHEIRQVKDDVKGFEDILFKSVFRWSDIYISPAMGVLIIVLLVVIWFLYIRLRRAGKSVKATQDSSQPAKPSAPSETAPGGGDEAEATGEGQDEN
jgi:predicted PurR-regulated permease PerM